MSELDGRIIFKRAPANAYLFDTRIPVTSGEPKVRAEFKNGIEISSVALTDCLIMDGDPIKRIKDDVYGGYLVRFTDEGAKDLTGEYFDGATDFMLGSYPLKGLRALYEHGFDEAVGSIPIGEIIEARKDEKGLWVEERFDFIGKFKSYLGELDAPEQWKKKQLESAQAYHDMIRDMLDNGVLVMEGGRPVRKSLGWSSGAHPPSVRVSANGHIDRWPIWEATNTVRPAMPGDTSIRPLKSFRATQLKDLLADVKPRD